MTDQDFPGGCANSQNGCANLLFCNFFAENCMKMKEFGPGVGRVPGAPLDPPLNGNKLGKFSLNANLPMSYCLELDLQLK